MHTFFENLFKHYTNNLKENLQVIITTIVYEQYFCQFCIKTKKKYAMQYQGDTNELIQIFT